MIKYTKVKNRGFDLEKYISRGLYIQEKLDGSNASFTINDNNEFEVFSRRTKLDPHNTLNDFYNWAHNLYESLNSLEEKLLKEYILYGEWLVKHKVNYKDSAYKEFYLFDIYSKEHDEYLGLEDVENVANLLKLKQPEIFEVITPENIHNVNLSDLLSYKGKSKLTVPKNTGEGIVIKYLNGKKESEDYFKLVTEEFKEIHRQKMAKPKPSDNCLADYAITDSRLRKMIYRAVDEGRLREDDIQLENFSKVIKEVGDQFTKDIIEEELDNMLKVLDKQIKRKIPNILRPMLEQFN